MAPTTSPAQLPVPRPQGADASRRTLIRRRAIDLMRTPHGICRR